MQTIDQSLWEIF